MATKGTKYQATHEGRTFTRTSPRTYTHAVVVKGNVYADRERCERQTRETWTMNLAYHQAKAAGTSRFLERSSWESPEAHQARVTETQAKAAAYLDGGVEAEVLRQLAAFDLRLKADLAKGFKLDDDGTYWSCAGWCGRPDLAAKLASKEGGVAVAATVK